MEAADEELDGLLAGEDDDDDLSQQQPKADTATVANWDVEKVWKRTRLRIMVYTRLGELEDEDEERYVQQERGLSMDEDEDDDAALVSWASAIFLTSVIEYVAEQSLLISGTAAYAHMAAKRKKLAQQTEDARPQELAIERLVVEEPHVEKIALNSALGRLWRTWRKRVRSPSTPLLGRGVRPVSSYSSLHLRKASRDTIDAIIQEDSTIPEHPPTETEIASNIPLPQGDNDINEIEVPGLAQTFEDDADSLGSETPVQRPPRPSSVYVPLSALARGRDSNKRRPLSLPMRPAPPFTVSPHASPAPSISSENGDLPFETPMERMEGADSYIDEADEESVDRQREATKKQLESPTETAVSSKATTAVTPATTVTAAAVAAMGASAHNSHNIPVQTRELDQGGDTAKEAAQSENIATGGHESEPQVLRSKRMSVERPGPPGVVRSFSKQNSSRRSSQQTQVAAPTAAPVSTPDPKAASYLNHESSDDDQEVGQKAIGVARTSDVPILSTSTSSFESPRAKGRVPGHGGHIEAAPRQVAPTPFSTQSSSVPVAEPIVSERSVARVDPIPSQPEQSVQSTKPVQTNKHSPTDDNTTDSFSQSQSNIKPPRKQETPVASPRNGSLPSLQESDSSKATQVPETALHPSPIAQSSQTKNSPPRSPPRSTDSPGTVAERRGRRTSSDSPRSQVISHARSLSEKTSLKRVTSSSSSAKRSNGATAISSGRDSIASHRSRGLSTRMSEEDREREFDSLVKGQDTVKFTLTPQTMRALDKTPLAKKAEPPKPSSPPSNITVYPRANAEDGHFGTGNLPRRTFSRNRGPGPVAAKHKPSPSRKVVSKPMAREARVDNESLRDFADFIRSTGPSPGQEKPVKPFVGVNGSGSTSSLGRSGPTSPPSSRADGSSTKSRVTMEPRSPAGLSDGNNDLIDFIRQGPPNANAGQPRIPRNVAPFRSTVDSDQFDTMLGGRNVESAFGSTSSTLNSKHSATTVNSRTGLIPAPSVVQPAYSNAPQQLSGSMSANEPTITRTRHRVKDPYAIDISDEEDEDDDQLTALPPSIQAGPSAQPPKQESLMDFLNGTEPPSNSKPQPFMLSEETISAARARAAASSNTSLSSSNTTTRNGTGPGLGPVSTSSVSSGAPRAYKPRLQARAPAVSDVRTGGGSRTGTSDLADFLRESGPDVVSPRHASPPVPYGKVAPEEKKSRKFWKSRKSEKTYGDLP
ncbi:predicted protein [Plenodomus lingam JN3]|uniref:Predicted protein n=2 Tax=Leptosphaeria maculans TaxID=5022 RepID=E5A9R0_LEPMJ|nr:predicted protein [Plenodomus lingam JN3]CBY00401.1 predicted protein [Plenodomus lingam JN3]